MGLGGEAGELGGELGDGCVEVFGRQVGGVAGRGGQEGGEDGEDFLLLVGLVDEEFGQVLVAVVVLVDF